MDTNQSFRGGRARALSDEAVPTPHPTIAGNETLANGKDLTFVGFGDGDLLEPPYQFCRSEDMISKAFRTGRQSRIGRSSLASAPMPWGIAFADRGICIFAERRCERSLVTRLRGKVRNDRSAAMLECGRKSAVLGLRSRESGPRRRELRFCQIALFRSFRAALVGFCPLCFG